jgi:hypothetical protein
MRTKVEMIRGDDRHNNWKIGDKGYIDGYYYWHGPYVVVVIDDRIISAELYDLKVIHDESTI